MWVGAERDAHQPRFAKDEYPRLTRAIALLTVLLVTTTGVACAGAGSEDGREGRIAFAIELDGDWRLVTARADGSGDLTVLRHPRGWPVSDAAWSADGKKIAYNDFAGFSVMNADGTGVRQVVESAGGPLINFAWSPDGREIALVLFDGLYVVDADGTNRRLILRCGGDCEGWPVWSPDGRKIAFETYIGPVDSASTSYLVNRDGTGKRAFITTDGELSWSPDGKQIAFNRAPFTYVMDGDGSGERRLGRGWGPVWSPDGSSIAFTRADVVYAMSSDGSGERRLGRGEFPLWSLNGTRIVFTRNDVWYAINSDGSGERRLGPGEDLSWSPSGNQIAVSRDFRKPSLTAPETAIWVLNVDEGGGRQIWPRKGLCECGSPAWQP